MTIHLSPELEDIQQVLVLQHAEGTVEAEDPAFQKTKWQVEKVAGVEGVEGVAEPRPKWIKSAIRDSLMCRQAIL